MSAFPSYEQQPPVQANEDASNGAFGNQGQVQQQSQSPQNTMSQAPGASEPLGFSDNNTSGPQTGSTGAPPADGAENKTTLWMGELEPWIDENFIRQMWYNQGEQVNVKMIRDKFSGSNAGYCFVDFQSTESAAKALAMNGQMIPGASRPFKLNWASGGGLADRSREERGPEFSIFVGDLGPEVNEYSLFSLFQSKFPSCKSAKIMSDPITGMSRGYGFVRFADDQEQQSALQTMQGVYCGNRPMRISTATPKQRGGPSGMMGNQGGGPMHQTPMNMQSMGSPVPHHQAMTHGGQPVMGFYGQGAPQQPMYGGYQPQPGGGPHGGQQPMNQFTDPNNTTVFVGGLSGYVTEDELRSFFQGFGEITYVKIPPGKGCGFVQFVQRHAAEMAINQMQGYPIGNSRVRLSWGRSQNNSGPAGTPYRPAPVPPMGMQGPMTPMAQGGMGVGMGPMSPMQQGGPVGYYGQPYGPAGGR